MRRTQIYLPGEQTDRLDRRASAEGVTRSMLIRRAVDEYLARDERVGDDWRARWQAALRRSAGSAPTLPDGADYVEALRAADADRLKGL